jgi:hypothetical protein
MLARITTTGLPGDESPITLDPKGVNVITGPIRDALPGVEAGDVRWYICHIYGLTAEVWLANGHVVSVSSCWASACCGPVSLRDNGSGRQLKSWPIDLADRAAAVAAIRAAARLHVDAARAEADRSTARADRMRAILGEAAR